MDFARRTRLPLDEGATTSLAWEDAPCPLCGCARWSARSEAADPLPGEDGLRFLIVQCQDCGLCYTNPRPGPDGIASFYPDDYPSHRRCAPPSPGRSWLGRRRRDPLADLLPVVGKGRLLDFGCGAGDFLVQAQQLGWNPVGLDASPRVVEKIRVELGIPALVGSLPHADLADRSFEAITMWQSLEHVHRPLDVLRCAHRLLVPGGRLIVAAPNLESCTSRWFGPHWHGLDVPRRLTHFTPWTLRLMLHRAGFFNPHLQMLRNGSWVRHSARLAQQRGDGGPLAKLLQTRLLSSVASWYAHLTRQSDRLLAVAVKV